MKIVWSTSTGNDALCDIPSFENFLDSIIKPTCRLFILALVCLALPVATILSLDGIMAISVSLLLLLPSLFYFPVAFIRLSIMENITGLSPAECFDTIREIPGPYLLLCACSLPIWAFLLITPFYTMFNFYTLPVQYYLICVYLNIMGKFYLKYKEEFDINPFIP